MRVRCPSHLRLICLAIRVLIWVERIPRVGGRCPGDRGARRRLCDRGARRRLCAGGGCRCLCVRDDCRRLCGLVDLRFVSVSMGPCRSICILCVLQDSGGRSGCSVSTWRIVCHRNCRRVVTVRDLSRRRVRVVVLVCAVCLLSLTLRVYPVTYAFRDFRAWPLVWVVCDQLSLAGLLPPSLGVFY